jgi:hypothetical protein
LRDIARYWFPLTVDKCLARVTLNGNAQMPVDGIAVMNYSGNRRGRFSKSHRLMQVVRSKRSCMREQLDRFEPVCLTLTVIAVKDIETGCAINLSAKVTKILNLDSLQKHAGILT